MGLIFYVSQITYCSYCDTSQYYAWSLSPPQPIYFSVWHIFRCRLTAGFEQFTLQVIQTLMKMTSQGLGQTGSQRSLSLISFTSSGVSGDSSGSGFNQSSETISGCINFLSGLRLTPTLITQETVTVCCLWVLTGGLSVINHIWQLCAMCS